MAGSRHGLQWLWCTGLAAQHVSHQKPSRHDEDVTASGEGKHLFLVVGVREAKQILFVCLCDLQDTVVP